MYRYEQDLEKLYNSLISKFDKNYFIYNGDLMCYQVHIDKLAMFINMFVFVYEWKQFLDIDNLVIIHYEDFFWIHYRLNGINYV